MKPGLALQYWTSFTSPSVRASEADAAISTPLAFENAIANLATLRSENSAFFVLRVSALSGSDAARMLEVASDAKLGKRLCLALDHRLLAEFRRPDLSSANVSFMLDDVDDQTPLAALSHEMLEAVRFRTAFVGRASRNLRDGCVLDAMLSLARNLGLCTFGPVTASNENSIGCRPEFDYVASAFGIPLQRKDAEPPVMRGSLLPY